MSPLTLRFVVKFPMSATGTGSRRACCGRQSASGKVGDEVLQIQPAPLPEVGSDESFSGPTATAE